MQIFSSSFFWVNIPLGGWWSTEPGENTLLAHPPPPDSDTEINKEFSKYIVIESLENTR